MAAGHARIAQLAAQRNPDPNQEDSEAESSQGDEDYDSELEEVTQKAVDRRKKLTKQQRNKKEKNKAIQEELRLAKKRRIDQKQYEKVDLFVREDAKETKKIKEKQEKKYAENAEERKRQEETGLVTKGGRIGKVVYKMKKTDFQLEDDLAGSLRELRAQNHDDLLRDRFDSIFRQNLVEIEDMELTAKRRREMKAEYKFKQRTGGVYSSLTEKLHKKNQKKAKELKQK